LYFYIFKTFICSNKITNAKEEQAFMQKSCGKTRLFLGWSRKLKEEEKDEK